jgi:hypothetical protein
MKHEIPAYWREQVRRHIQETWGEDRDYLLAHDFPVGQSVRAVFPDGSEFLFRYAFYLADTSSREVAVFTEHCGYHYFPLVDVQIERVREEYEEEVEEEPTTSPFVLLERVVDRDTFLRFVRALAASQNSGGVNWAYERAGDYLEAAAAWADDAQLVGGGLAMQASWRGMAEFLYAGAIYE